MIHLRAPGADQTGMEVRGLLTAQALATPQLPPAHDLREGAARIVDGQMWTIRNGMWMPVAGPGETIPLPDIPVEPPRPDEEPLPPLTYFMSLAYVRNNAAWGILTPLTAVQQPATGDNTAPIKINGDMFQVGMSGTYPIQLQLTQIHDLPTAGHLNVFVRKIRPGTPEVLQHVLGMTYEPGGLRYNHGRNEGPNAWGNEAVLDLLTGDLLRFEIQFTALSGPTTADDVPSAFTGYLQFTPMVEKSVDTSMLGSLQIIGVTTTHPSWPSSVHVAVLTDGDDTYRVLCRLWYFVTMALGSSTEVGDETTRVTVSKDPTDFETIDLDGGGGSWEGDLPVPGAGVEPGTMIEYRYIVTAYNESGIGVATSWGSNTPIP